MLRTRVIPCLLLKDENLVKTVKFKQYHYIGDPINTVRIFNELEVDELMFLDILASREQREIQYDLLANIANECFMPMSYGGNIRSLDDAKEIFRIGFEKVVLNSHLFNNLGLLEDIAGFFGRQSVICAIDAKRDFFGRMHVYSHNGTVKQSLHPVKWAQMLESAGAGEILVTAIDRDGTWQGYDDNLIRSISSCVCVPVIANGGAGSVTHMGSAVHEAGASAVAVGSMVVYQKQGMGVLVNFPDATLLANTL